MENVTDFDFYLKFTKPLILSLPQINDRVLAAAWVKRLTEDKDAEDKIKLDYLKLLLFVLQRKKLVTPFTQHPSSLETLEAFPEEQSLIDVARTIIEKEKSEKRAETMNKLKGLIGSFPPYISDFSADLLEYVAVQKIEDFGVHAYYAISKEPLSTWHRVDKQLLPKAAKSMLEVSPTPPTLVEVHSTPEITEKSPEKEKPGDEPPVEVPPAETPPEEESPPESTEPETEPVESPPKKPRKTGLGATPPSRPIGRVSPPPEDREPPTWGSNLLEAKFLEPDVEDLGIDLSEFEAKPKSPSAAAAPMELLWSSSPTAADDLFLTGADDYGGLDISMPSFLETSMAHEMGSPPPAWTSAASLPYLTPRIPGVTPPPPTKKLKQKPPVRQTRASLLLQKKKEAEKGPPLPPPKKPIKRPQAKISKPKIEAKEEAPPVKKPSKEEAGGKKVVGKKRSKGTIKGKKPAKSALPTFASPGEPFKGFGGDEIDEYVSEYNRTLAELEADYAKDRERYQAQRAASRKEAEISAREAHERRQNLSQIARQSPQTIPKEHDIPLDIDKSIHLSPEARQMLEEIVEGPAAADLPPSPIRHPTPKLQDSFLPGEDFQFGEDMEGIPTEESEGEEYPIEYATTEAPPGESGKDPRIVEAYNRMVDTSMKIQEEKDLDYDDFEAMERMVEEQMKAEGKDPHAKSKPTSSKDFYKGLKRYKEMHERAEAQYDDLNIDYDDFEAMERMVEDQMVAEGKDPHAKSKTTSSKDFYKGLKRYKKMHDRAEEQYEDLKRAAVLPSYIQEENIDDADWQGASQFFKQTERDYVATLTTPEKVKHMFPEMEVEEEDEVDVDAELLPEGMIETLSPTNVNQQLGDLAIVYRDYLTLPAFQKVPVTVPRRAVTPKRPSPTRGPIEGLIDIPELKHIISPTEEHKKLFPPSPPHFDEEFGEIPTSPSQVIDKYPPESWQFQYDSPGIQYVAQKPIPTIDTSGISPRSRTWYSDLDELHRKLYALPPPEQTEPTAFDVPVDRVYAESPPREWASPVSPQLSPAIDPEALKALVRQEAIKPPGRIRTYGKRSRLDQVKEGIYEPPEYLTEEDLELRKRLKEHEANKERRGFKFPYKKTRRLQGKQAPGLEAVEEWAHEPTKDRTLKVNLFGELSEFSPPTSFDYLADEDLYKTPPKEHPDVFDFPDMEDKIWGEELPEGFASPTSPGVSPIDQEALKKAIREGAKVERVIEDDRFRIKAPGKQKPRKMDNVSERLEDLPEDEWQQVTRIWGASKRLPKRDEEYQKIAKKSGLPIIGSPVEYPESPTTRRPAEESPTGRQGPIRRTVRRKLKKRKLDFDREPTTPTETEIEVTDVDAVVEDERELYPELPKEMQEDIDLLLYSPSPPKHYKGSPRTPGVSDMREEEPPFPDELPEFSPVSPLSQYGVIQDTMAKVKEHQKIPFTKGKMDRKSKEYFQRYPWRLAQMTGIAEEPLEEAAAVIHDEIEADVEGELAQQAAQQRINIPEIREPFYTTPPHLRERHHGFDRHPDMTRTGDKGLFYHSRMASPTPEEQQDLEDFERAEQAMEALNLLEAEPAQYDAPQSPRTITAVPMRDVQNIAEAQYASLMSPQPEKIDHRANLPKTLSDVMNLVQNMPPSPGMIRLMQEQKAAEEAAKQAAIEFEYQQKVKQKEKKAAKGTKGVKGRQSLRERATKGGKPDKPIKGGKSDTSVKSKDSQMLFKRPRKKKFENIQSKVYSGVGQKKEEPKAKESKSDASVKSKPSTASMQKPRRKKFNVESKLDTGRGKAPVAKSSKASVAESKSSASIRSKASGTVFRTPRRKKYDVPSKLDTGRKSKGKTPKPEIVVQCDVAALQDLGISRADLENMNLIDTAGVAPEYNQIEEEYYDTQVDPREAEIQRPQRSRSPQQQLQSELQSEVYYDPETQYKTKIIKVKGRTVPAHEHHKITRREVYGPEPKPVSPRRGLDEVALGVTAADFRLQYGHELPQAPSPSPPVKVVGAESAEGETDDLAEMEAPWVGSPSVLEAVNPEGILRPDEQTAMFEAGAARPPSPGPYDYTWGGQSPVGPSTNEYEWMSPTKYTGKWPWEE